MTKDGRRKDGRAKLVWISGQWTLTLTLTVTLTLNLLAFALPSYRPSVLQPISIVLRPSTLRPRPSFLIALAYFAILSVTSEAICIGKVQNINFMKP